MNLCECFFPFCIPGGMWDLIVSGPGPEVIKHFSSSAQVSMKFVLLINVQMPTIVGIFTFISKKNSILGLPEPEKSCLSEYFLYL